MIGELAALGAAICWTMSAVLYKRALLTTQPLAANILRCVSAATILVLSLVVSGTLGSLASLPVATVLLASMSGILGLAFGDTLYMMSLKTVGVSKAVPITCSYPMFNLLIAIATKGEIVTWQVVVGTISITLGVWLISLERNKKGQRNTSIGVVYALTTALSWAISIAIIDVAVNLNEAGSVQHAWVINTVRISAAAMILLGLAPFSRRHITPQAIRKVTFITLLFGGVVALAVGWFLLTFSFLHVPSSQAVPISSTTPLFATLSGIAILDERATKRNALGSVIIVVGIFLLFMIRT